MIQHDDGLKILARHVRDEIVIAAYGVAIDWDALLPRPMNFFSTGAMSLSSAHGLGFALGRPEVVREGRDVLFAACGSIVHEALEAARRLEADGVSAAVAVVAHLASSASPALVDLLRRFGSVVSVEQGRPAEDCRVDGEGVEGRPSCPSARNTA